MWIETHNSKGLKLEDLKIPTPPFLEMWGALDSMFIGPLPKVGDVVEIVCTEAEPNHMKFKLRIKQ
jgi:hypothetical protein